MQVLLDQKKQRYTPAGFTVLSDAKKGRQNRWEVQLFHGISKWTGLFALLRHQYFLLLDNAAICWLDVIIMKQVAAYANKPAQISVADFKYTIAPKC